MLSSIVVEFQFLVFLSAALSPRLAHNERLGAGGGGTIQFRRDTNVHIPTALSAALHPRLRQTASYALPFSLHLFYWILSLFSFYFNNAFISAIITSMDV
jgi:hypothetical protein